jgi:hypothetical protein
MRCLPFVKQLGWIFVCLFHQWCTNSGYWCIYSCPYIVQKYKSYPSIIMSFESLWDMQVHSTCSGGSPLGDDKKAPFGLSACPRYHYPPDGDELTKLPLWDLAWAPPNNQAYTLVCLLCGAHWLIVVFICSIICWLIHWLICWFTCWFAHLLDHSFFGSIVGSFVLWLFSGIIQSRTV